MRWLLIVSCLALTAAPLSGQGWIEPERPHPDWGVARVRTAVSVRVTGRVAHVEVEEWFTNRGPALGEGDYHYPLPGEAVFSGFSLFQGEMELRGETMDAAEARRIYEEIVRRKRDPALIELAGHGLLRARVFPIAPGDTRKITLRYTQVLERAGDALHWRYVAGTRAGGDHGTERPPLTLTVTVDGAGVLGEPFSPTHVLRSARDGERLTIRTAETPAGPVSIFLPFARETVGLTLVTHRVDAEPGYFMLTVSPGAVSRTAAPRDLTVVIDVSGSMSGGKLAQAQAALRQLLGTLDARDRFRLIRFSNGVVPASPTWVSATPDAVREARSWVDGLEAEGGTNIDGALEEAFRIPSPDDRLPVVVFLTDGLPSVGERDPERIADRAARHLTRQRIFTFGVGHDVNTYLLDRLTAAGRGATQYVGPGEDVEAALGTLAAKIQRPVLTDLALEVPLRVTEVYPGPLPDLFHGEELVVFGRYEPAGDEARQIVVVGRRAGRRERFTTTAAFPAHAAANEFLPTLWAARKLGALQRTLRLEGASDALIEEIRQTALRYGLLSEYTSYLVQEPGLAQAGGRPQFAPLAPVPAADRTASAAEGAAAVAVARADGRRREVRRLTDVAAAEEQLRARAHGPDARAVAGRMFMQRGGVWTDLRHADSLRVVSVRPFSPVYFALLRRLPELVPYVTAFGEVLVAGARVSIRVAHGGAAALDDVDAVVRAFRGP